MRSIAGASRRARTTERLLQVNAVSEDTERGARADRVVRHVGLDRAIHWVVAASVITLLATGFLPILGLEFAWVTIHWAAGFVLIAVVALHIVRALFWQDWREVWSRKTPCTRCSVGPMLEFNLLFQRPFSSALQAARSYG